MEAPFSFLPSSLLNRGFVAASLAILLTAALELTCLDEVRKLCASNKALYRSALWTNLFNNMVLGSITYYVAVYGFCQPPGQLSVTEQLQAIIGIVLIEAVLYYVVHKSFHEVKGLYWMHSYHHKFNTVVVPSSANAVSVAEYVVAYMLPLVIGIVLTRADEMAAFLGSAVVAITNLLIHTPWLEQQQNSYHWVLVSAADHLSHHRKTRGNYGAPVFHIDRIMERCASFRQTNQAKSAG